MKYFWLSFLFFVVAYLVPLGGRPLVPPDEFRYAEIPREMMDSGSYAAPHLLTVRYFEKPVLGYWMTAGSFKIFGQNAFALRLPCALGAGLAAFLIFFLVNQTLRDDKLAALASMLFLTSGLVYGVSTFAVLDSQTTGLITGILVTSFLAVLEPGFTRRRVLLLALCGLFAGLAFMTKGFIAWVVPGLAMAGFLIWERRWKEFYLLPWIPAVVALVIVAPWALAVHRAEPDYWNYFVMIEHVQRFTAKTEGQHPEPFWYYIPVLLGGVFPAAFLAPAAFAIGRKAWGNLLAQPLYRFCVCAAVLPFLFFSASSGKLGTYILPCFPPLAVLGAGAVACYFRAGDGRSRAFHRVMNFWGGALVLAGTGVLVIELGGFESYFAEHRVLAVLTGAAGLVYGLALLLTAKQVWRVRLYIFFAGFAAVLALGGWAIPEGMIGDKMPERALKQLPEKLGFDTRKAVLVTHPAYMHAVAWVYHRPDVRSLNTVGELDYGDGEAEKRGEPRVFISTAELVKLLKKPGRPGVVYITRESREFKLPEPFPHQEAVIAEMKAIYFPPLPVAEEVK